METVSSEFAAVEVGVDRRGNGPRLRIEDLKTGQVGYLDALELETLAWLPEGALHPLLDPSALRWREESSTPTIDELVRQLYAALEAGDAARIESLMTEDFDGQAAAGLPLGAGGHHQGAKDMIENVWWTLGRAFKVRAEPSEWIPCAGGRLLVLGRYKGIARSTQRPLDAPFAHVWAARGDRLSSLRQLTDTAAWGAALEPAPGQSGEPSR